MLREPTSRASMAGMVPKAQQSARNHARPGIPPGQLSIRKVCREEPRSADSGINDRRRPRVSQSHVMRAHQERGAPP